MLKPIPSRDTKLYLYSSVVLPLKNLNVDFPSIPSPFTDKETGRSWNIELVREPVTERIRHNYQRDRQERVRNWLVVFRDGGSYNSYPIAYYDKRHHNVKLYEFAFKKLGIPHLLGQFYEMFDTHTPFTKVIIDHNRSEYLKLTRKMGVDISHMPF